MGLLEQHGSDAVRYWAASGRPGADTAFDEGQMKIGRRLAIKILNASRFVLLSAGNRVDPAAVTHPLDLPPGPSGHGGESRTTQALDDYNYTRALEPTETFFWSFCDDYLELVKARAADDSDPAGQASAQAALRVALRVLLRLFAPFLPFVTEEVWSWWQPGSVHRTDWPTVAELPSGGDPDLSRRLVGSDRIRKAKVKPRWGCARSHHGVGRRNARTGGTDRICARRPDRSRSHPGVAGDGWAGPQVLRTSCSEIRPADRPLSGMSRLMPGRHRPDVQLPPGHADAVAR